MPFQLQCSLPSCLRLTSPFSSSSDTFWLIDSNRLRRWSLSYLVFIEFATVAGTYCEDQID